MSDDADNRIGKRVTLRLRLRGTRGVSRRPAMPGERQSLVFRPQPAQDDRPVSSSMVKGVWRLWTIHARDLYPPTEHWGEIPRKGLSWQSTWGRMWIYFSICCTSFNKSYSVMKNNGIDTLLFHCAVLSSKFYYVMPKYIFLFGNIGDIKQEHLKVFTIIIFVMIR